jgi:hypothetical protein
MKKSVLIQLDQKDFETVIFKAVCQAIKLNSISLSDKQERHSKNVADRNITKADMKKGRAHV